VPVMSGALWFSLRCVPRSQRRVAAISSVYRACLKSPFFTPFETPLPSATPCIRHLRRPLTGADLQRAQGRLGHGSDQFRNLD
jgi:hypothetical protein